MSAPERTGPAPDEVRSWVRERYSRIVESSACCTPPTGTPSDAVEPPKAVGCCGGSGSGDGGACCADGHGAEKVGYSADDLAALPSGSELGLGCGNPTALAELRLGEVVVDLGSGAGVDAFLAARRVGPSGRVIGVDMTPAMVERARANARDSSYRQVEFRLGEIEHLPVADGTADVIVSNCVINLSADKPAVYRESFRVLRPGGRLIVSDMVATRPIAPEDRADAALWSSCSSGALDAAGISEALTAAGFTDISVTLRGTDRPVASLEGQAGLGVYPADIRARRPVE